MGVELGEKCLNRFKEINGRRRDEELTWRLIEGDDQGLKCIKCLQLSLSVGVKVLEQHRQSLLDDGCVHSTVGVIICLLEHEEE